jgi:hypothetical protein
MNNSFDPLREPQTNLSGSSRYPVNREELYERVWATPISHLASEYGVSGPYMAQVCAALNVPRPPVGHWQKKAVGKDKPRPPLPPAQPGDQLCWSREVPLVKPVVQSRPAVRRRPARGVAATEVLHPLLRGTDALFRRTRKLDDYEFLRPYKQLLPDIVTTEACLPKALAYANALYTALDRSGHRVMLAPTDRPMRRAAIEEREKASKDRKYGRYSHGTIWGPYRPTITFIGAVPIGLTITEMTERVTLRYLKDKYVREDSDAVRSAKSWQLSNSWTHEQDVPCGRFRLVAYSPLPGVEWRTSWQETSKRSLDSFFPEIVRELSRISGELAEKEIEANEAAARRQREWEAQQERWRREDDRRKVVAANEASQKQLTEIIQQWSERMAIEQFFRTAEARIADATPERREQLSGRLAQARSMMGTVDPLNFLEGWVAPDSRYKTRYFDD